MKPAAAQEALHAYALHVCGHPDAAFKSELLPMLAVAGGTAEISVSPALAVRVISLAVIRYSQCGDRTEHSLLRDTCIELIGNPWLRRTSWDAHVKNEPARQMVEGWLKRRLIKDFFELLAQDGSADLRRLNYWLKWEPQILDMWFVLGGDARRNSSPQFVEVRKRMAGRDRSLLGRANDQNNAFVMRVGHLLIIEFGLTNNACYVLPASAFRADLSSKTFSMVDLKQKSGARWLSHVHHWEPRFDSEVRAMLQDSSPVRVSEATINDPSVLHRRVAAPVEQTPRATARTGVEPSIKRLCSIYGVRSEDHREKGGALWVFLKDRDTHKALAQLLDSGGFKYVKGKGFWFI
jgi:hypothetical protein